MARLIFQKLSTTTRGTSSALASVLISGSGSIHMDYSSFDPIGYGLSYWITTIQSTVWEIMDFQQGKGRHFKWIYCAGYWYAWPNSVRNNLFLLLLRNSYLVYFFGLKNWIVLFFRYAFLYFFIFVGHAMKVHMYV